MPEIHDQNNACLIALMPCLMLERIIKNISLPFFLLPNLIPNTHTTILDSGKGQVKPQFLISGSIMFHNMGIGGQCTNEGMMVIIGNVRIDHLHDERHFLTIVVEFHVMELEIEDIPHATVYRFVTHPILCLTLGNPRGTTIRLETLLITKG